MAINKTDILVVGGGMAGVMAALAAKQQGNRVLLVDAGSMLGGQGTLGGVAGFCGDTINVNEHLKELIARLQRQRLIRDFNPTEDRRSYDLEWCAYFLQEMVLERDIDVLLHTRVIGARSESGSIVEVDLVTGGGPLTVRPKIAIDATGSCLLPVMAGCPVREEGANRQLPMGLYFTMWDTGRPIQPFLPAGGAIWKTEEDLPMTTLHVFDSGKVEVKMKVVGFDASDGMGLSQAEMHARRQMVSLVYHLQTKGYGGVILDRHVLASVSRQIGVREARRIVGEHVLTVEEVCGGKVFEDAVAVGTYHLDYHWPDRVQRGDTGVTTMVEPYHIPLRSMIPLGMRNLLVPGRGASGDQMAMSSYRVMAVVAQMGFAAGKAAQLCVEERTDMDHLDLARLQGLIEAGGQALNLSVYGVYLRSGLLDQECVAVQGGASLLAGAPSILQLRNNRFLVVWVGCDPEDGGLPGLWVADRFECRWSAPRALREMDIASPSNPVLWLNEDGVLCLGFESASGENWRMSSDDEGKTWTQPTRAGGMDAKMIPAATLDLGASVRAAIRAQPKTTAESGAELELALSLDAGTHWPHALTLAKSTPGQMSASLIRTPRGVAATYIDPEGRVQFWHGSVEQIMNPRALEALKESLRSGIMP